MDAAKYIKIQIDCNAVRALNGHFTAIENAKKKIKKIRKFRRRLHGERTLTVSCPSNGSENYKQVLNLRRMSADTVGTPWERRAMREVNYGRQRFEIESI